MRKQTLRFKAWFERHRNTYRQYLPWVMKLINESNESSDAGHILQVTAPDASSVESLILKRRGVIRGDDTVLIVLDFTSDDIASKLYEVHKARDSVQLIYCSMQIPFMHWLLMHRGVRPCPQDLRGEFMKTFGIAGAEYDPEEDISQILACLTLQDVHTAAAVYDRLYPDMDPQRINV